MAGLLEGEGCFMAGSPSAPKNCKVVIQTTDRDVAEEAMRLMGAKSMYTLKKSQPHHKQAYRVRRDGNPAREIMRRLYPLFSDRRKKAITAALR